MHDPPPVAPPLPEGQPPHLTSTKSCTPSSLPPAAPPPLEGTAAAAATTPGDRCKSPLLESLNARLLELEEEHRLCGGTPVAASAAAHAGGGTFAAGDVAYSVMGGRAKAKSVSKEVYKSDLSTLLLELKGRAIAVLTASRRRANGVASAAEENAILDTDAVAESSQCASEYLDRFQWTAGSELTIPSILAETSVALTEPQATAAIRSLPEEACLPQVDAIVEAIARSGPDEVQTLFELLGGDDAVGTHPAPLLVELTDSERNCFERLTAAPQAHCSSGGDDGAEEEGAENAGGGSAPAAPAEQEGQLDQPSARVLLQGVHEMFLRWDARFPRCFAKGYLALLRFETDNPRTQLEAVLKEDTAKLLSSEGLVRDLGDKQEQLLTSLNASAGKPSSNEMSRAALHLIATAEERARVMEESMRQIQARWKLIEANVEALSSVAWPEAEASIEALDKLSKLHAEEAASARADADRLGRYSVTMEEEESAKLNELDVTLIDSQRELDESGEAYAQQWKALQGIASGLTEMLDERVRKVSRHCELVDEAQRRAYDMKVREELVAEHAARLGQLEARHLAFADRIEGVRNNLDELHRHASSLKHDYEASTHLLFEHDGKVYASVLESYCRLVGDLLSRRSNRVGAIDIEGTMLQAKVDAAQKESGMGGGDTELPDMMQLKALRKEKAQIQAYITGWKARLNAHVQASQDILKACELADPSVELYSQLDETSMLYEEKRKALVANMQALQEGYVTFAEEQEQEAVELTPAEYRAQHSAAMGISDDVFN